MEDVESLKDKRWELLFNVYRSRFYHNSFERFYILISRIFILIMTIFSILSITFFAQKNPELSAWMGVLAAIISFIDLLFSPSNKASIHCYKASRFLQLATRIHLKENPIQEDISLWKEIRFEIEDGNESIYHALNILCHNRAVDSLGGESIEKYKLSFWQKRFRHIWTFDDVDFR